MHLETGRHGDTETRRRGIFASSILRVSASLCVLAANLSGCVSAAEKKSERTFASPWLSANELAAVRELFEKLSAAFLSHDAAACLRLVAAGSPERGRIMAGLEREFRQSRYLTFEVAELWPEDKLSDKVHSVAVLLRYELQELDYAPLTLPSPQGGEGGVRGNARDTTLKDSNIYTFVVKDLGDGTFALVNSQFFDTLGLRHGLGVVPRAVVMSLALCIFLAFWVWMGLEAFRARPRSHLWRAVVAFVPLLGASTYFFGVYLPNRLKGE